MAEVIEALEAKTPPKATHSYAADQRLPIEQRTDVTVDELERISLPYPAELYNGRVVYKMANPAHGMLQGRVFAKLDQYLAQNPIGYAMTETNFRLWPDRPNESRIPDVAFVKKDRMPKNPYRFPLNAPDLAVEIISPDDNAFDIWDKVDEYLAQGTQFVWLIFPKKREVLICTAINKQSVRDVLTAPDLLPGFELPVSEIFEGIPLQENS
jgi:Uma2 family endonuclease